MKNSEKNKNMIRGIHYFSAEVKPKLMSSQGAALISKYLHDIHILYGHYWIPHTQKHVYRHQKRSSVQIMAKCVI